MLWAHALASKPKAQYLVHEWAREFNAASGTNITVLLLPVAHPALNPIEVMWGQIKRYVRDNNHTFKMDEIAHLAKERKEQQGSDAWTAAFKHTWDYAVSQWRADELLLEEGEDISGPEYVPADVGE